MSKNNDTVHVRQDGNPLLAGDILTFDAKLQEVVRLRRTSILKHKKWGILKQSL